jgi:hypothetical protein
MKDGKIAEMGTHEELMALHNGLYRHLNEVQGQIDPQWELTRTRRQARVMTAGVQN